MGLFVWAVATEAGSAWWLHPHITPLQHVADTSVPTSFSTIALSPPNHFQGWWGSLTLCTHIHCHRIQNVCPPGLTQSHSCMQKPTNSHIRHPARLLGLRSLRDNLFLMYGKCHMCTHYAAKSVNVKAVSSLRLQLHARTFTRQTHQSVVEGAKGKRNCEDVWAAAGIW